MRLWTVLGMVLLLVVPLWADSTPTGTSVSNRQIADDEVNPLPRSMTEAERGLPLPSAPFGLRTPPSGAVYCPPEYAECDGLLIRWGTFNTILTDLAVGATVQDPTAKMYVVVSGASQQSSAYTTLSNAGCDMNRIEFITAPTDSVWIRDYGPRFIMENGARAIVDHTYNRPRYNDNDIPGEIAAQWGEPLYYNGLTHGGGNFHLFANGEAFMSSLILTENPSLTEAQIKDIYLQYQNLDVTIYPGFPTSFDSTQHIDMWMMPVDDDEVIIGEYASTTGQPYTITENATTDMTSRGYTVHRTPGWQSSGTHYTYTNAVVLNSVVMMPTYSGYTTQNAQAQTVFETAFEDKTVIPVDCSSIISLAGAIHCIVMHVPSAAPVTVPQVSMLAPNGGEILKTDEVYYVEWTATDDIGVTSVDLYLSTDGGATYPETIATGLPNSGLHVWVVPTAESAACRVKAVAHDGEGNTGEDASAANFTISQFGPETVYSFPLNSDPGWAVQGQWAFGAPTGQGGTANGNPDPSSGATGANVYGVNLDGDYATTAGGPYYVTVGPLDLKTYGSTTLEFERWLNTDYQPYAKATVEVSNDNSSWTQVWANSGTAITDANWSLQELDISAIADDQAEVYVRWGYQIGSGAFAYSGWNIDDIAIIGIPQFAVGDVNCDGDIDLFDIDPFVMMLTNPAGYAATYPDCSTRLGDCDDDGDVDLFDIDPFVALLTGK